VFASERTAQDDRDKIEFPIVVERLAMYPPFARPPSGKSLIRQQEEFTSEGAPPPAKSGDKLAGGAGNSPRGSQPGASTKPAKPGKWRELK